MSISNKKLNDDLFDATVADSITTIHEVTVTDQSLTDLTDDKVKKTQFLGSLQSFFQREKQIHPSCRHSISIYSQNPHIRL